MQMQLLTDLENNTKAFLAAISKFTQEQFNKIPFEGSWTAGQVAQHIFKSESGIPAVWKGESIPTERPVDEKSGILKQIFLDFATKLKSPDFILPTDEPKDKETMYNALKSNREAIESLAANIDLSRTYTGFSIPGIGELTGEEAVTFIIIHSTRHIRQLEKIYEAVK
jgi:uncharacterized damage-inducible protein DinB